MVKKNLLSLHSLVLAPVLLSLAFSCARPGLELETAPAHESQEVQEDPNETLVFLPVVTTPSPLPESQIPRQADWVDYGSVLTKGVQGEWDLYLWGGFAFSIIKKDGTYYLYYQGSSDYRTAYDETVLWRTIGVATSQDGVNFVKYPHNPVLTWFPNQNGEEGAVSSGATLGPEGEIVLYYGANTEETPITINADGRAAFSSDGFSFTDRGMVLDHRNRAIWGHGDELFPINAIYDRGRWIVYYIPNGVALEETLGVAYGSSHDQLTNSAAVMDGSSRISVWGTAGHARIDDNYYALILNNVRTKRTEVRLTSLDAPDRMSEPIAVYDLGDAQQAVFYLDRDVRTWFMYYRAPDYYGVKLAPAGPIDTTPPSTPSGLHSTAAGGGQVNLIWQAAEDADTGVVQYRVYRGGVLVGKTRLTIFSEQNLLAGSTAQYQVSAVNFHGVEGEKISSLEVTVQ
jgi:hypothetical protein